MTPNDIDVLLWCHTRGIRHERWNAPAVQETHIWMKNAGIIELAKDSAEIYKTTDKGDMLVKMLCDTPFPVWADPRATQHTGVEREMIGQQVLIDELRDTIASIQTELEEKLMKHKQPFVAKGKQMRYLIIHEDHTLEQHDVLTGKLRNMARSGEISLIDTKEMRGLNAYESEFEGDWSDVPKYSTAQE